MSASDQKIAKTILKDPEQIINITISQLAKKAEGSDASITRFCRNLSLSGFHELKILLAQSIGQKESESLKELPKDDIQAALAQIEKNKIGEIQATLGEIPTNKLEKILSIIENSRVIQISAEGDTYPVAADAVYKFNQIGLLSFASGGNVETADAQTMNLGIKDCLIIISNSGESAALLKEIKLAKT
ncbi:MAG: MurR/RpiR family transcriptional regulator, partial [Lactobacillus sp.]|nr:MurR/RpiR family transcriptional regulator [Lactobacillus sp.]